MVIIHRCCRTFLELHVSRMLLRQFSIYIDLILIPTLALGTWATDVQAATDCMASVFARTNAIAVIDTDSKSPASVTQCNTGISFSNVYSGAHTAVSGSAVATGGGGTMTNTSVVTLPASEAVSQLTADYSQNGFGNYAFSRAEAQFTYQFKLLSTGVPTPAGTLHIPVLFTYAWATEIRGTGTDNNSTIFFQQTLGTGGRDMLRQGISAYVTGIPPVFTDVSQSCSDGVIGVAGSCDNAKLGFFNSSPFTVLFSVNTVGQDFDIELTARAIARVDAGPGLTGNSAAHARAFIDPVIEIRNDFKPYFSIAYDEGSLKVITGPPDTSKAGQLLPILQLLLEELHARHSTVNQP